MGYSAQEYIQNKLIDVAKEKVFNPNKSVSEIAYGLGFKYPHIAVSDYFYDHTHYHELRLYKPTTSALYL